jgi:hypothetical protein
MSKSKSKKSTFFWVCLILAILAVIALVVYLVMYLLKEKYNNECKFRPKQSQSKYHELNDMSCCIRDISDKKGDIGKIKQQKIKELLTKIAKFSCMQQSENLEMCIENFMKCGQRCINVVDQDLIELDKLEKGGDMKKVMEYVKNNILDEINQGECRTKKDLDILVEENSKKVLKERSATCYEMISNYF